MKYFKVWQLRASCTSSCTLLQPGLRWTTEEIRCYLGSLWTNQVRSYNRSTGTKYGIPLTLLNNIYIIFFTHDRLDDGSIVVRFPAGATISSLLQNVQACTIQWEPEGIFLRESWKRRADYSPNLMRSLRRLYGVHRDEFTSSFMYHVVCISVTFERKTLKRPFTSHTPNKGLSLHYQTQQLGIQRSRKPRASYWTNATELHVGIAVVVRPCSVFCSYWKLRKILPLFYDRERREEWEKRW